jgi:hypothetical protein
MALPGLKRPLFAALALVVAAKDNLADFVENSGAFTFSLTPPAPVSLSDEPGPDRYPAH